MVGHRARYRAWRFARSAGRAFADFLWPPRSLLSDARVSTAGAIEPELWSRLVFLGPPQCACCGFPFDGGEGEALLCGACLADPPAFDAARAALAYDELVRPLVLDLKRSGRRDGLALFGRLMADAAGSLAAEADAIAPVPLHWTRLVERRFNQSAWLAEAVAKATGRPLDLFALRRVRRRRSQGGLTAKQRALNVRGAFRADPERVAGRSLLLVDDVHTTGATLEACARALKKAGAVKVVAITLARVVRPVDTHI